jgi:DNA-binding MarR family transcriptional regulator
MKGNTKKQAQEAFTENQKKWTAILMEPGWTVLPTIILDKQAALGLTPLDINIILQIAKHWWYSERVPYPSKKAIAQAVGIDESTVRRRIARLEKDGFLKRQPRYHGNGGRKSNSYHFDGLIEAATPFAREAVETQRRRQIEDAERQKRKRPLKVIKRDEEE